VATKKKTSSGVARGWSTWSKERLLDTRICNLGLRLRGSWLQPRIERLYRELRARGLAFRPHFWLSDEWYCPDGVPGVAIPFFLAHPRLKRLEREFIYEVEGGSDDWCMRLLRHEGGHALLNAYGLDRRADWKKHFGRPSTRYPDTYLPRPYSRRYVLNLPNWYAQAHPHEDWAETFAVWLRPRANWRVRYEGWPALRKLEYVDALMDEVREMRPRLRNRRETHPIQKMRITLREYYEDKVERYGVDTAEFFDRDLRRLFSDDPQHARREKASRYIRRVQREVTDVVGRWTGEYNYRVNEVLTDMVRRCDRLKLHVGHTDEEMKPEVIACLTMLVMNKLHTDGFHISL